MVGSLPNPSTLGLDSGAIVKNNASVAQQTNTEALASSWFLPRTNDSLQAITAPIPGSISTSDPKSLALRVLSHICQ